MSRPSVSRLLPLLALLLLGLLGSSVRLLAAPSNDNYPGTTITGLPGVITGTTVGATHETNEAYVGDGTTVWYQWTAAASGGVTFSTSSANADNVLAVYSNGFTTNSRIGTSGNTSNYYGYSTTSSVTFHAVAGTTYEISVGGSNGQTGTFTLNWVAGPANDDFAAAQPISGLPGSVTGTTVGASHELNEAYVGDGSTVWYQWTAAVSGGVTFSTTSTGNSSADNVLSVYSNGFTTSSRIGTSNNTSNYYGYSTTSSVTFHAVAGTTYAISVGGSNGQTGTFTLNWVAGPANDDFVNAQSISGLPGSATGTTVGASHELNEAYVGDGSTVWYQWTAAVSGGVTFSTTSTGNFTADNVLAVYSGGFTTNSRIGISGNTSNYYGYSTTSSVTFHADAGTTYEISVGGSNGQTGTFTLNWVAGPANDDFAAAQPISGLPGSVTGTTVGASHELNEAYVGDGSTVWYQWTASANGGVTFSTTSTGNFTADNVLAVYSGGFTTNSRIGTSGNTSNYYGYSTTSSVTFNAVAGTTYAISVGGSNGQIGTFTLNWVAGPANDDFAAAQILSSPSAFATGTTIGASHELNEAYVGDGSTVWYQWTASANGGATFATTSTGNFTADNVLAVYSGGFTTNSRIGTSGNTSNYYGYSTTSSVTFNAVAGTTYNLSVGGSNGQIGTFTLYGGTAPANDNFVNAQVISGTTGEVTGINLPATTEPGEPAPNGFTGGASIWYKWTAPANGSITFDSSKSNFNTLLAVYTGPNVASLTPVGSNVYAGVVNLRKNTLTVTAGVAYYIAVDGVTAQTGQVVLDWNGTAAAAPVSTHVLWHNLNTGQTALWTVGTDGSVIGYAYPSLSGWTAKAVANGPDGLAHVLWNNTDGTIALWNVAANGTPAGITFGPYSGYTAKALAVGPDNHTHVLWNVQGGGIALWDLAPGGFPTGVSYGPFPGYTAKALAVSPDNHVHVLWNVQGGGIALWDIAPGAGPAGTAYSIPSAYTALALSAGPDNHMHVLWNHSPDSQIALWDVDTSGHPVGLAYGPYGGYSALALAVGSDNHTHVLWTVQSGGNSLWDLAPGLAPTGVFYNPGSGWAAVAIAAP